MVLGENKADLVDILSVLLTTKALKSSEYL